MRYKIGLIGCGRVGVLLEDDPLRGKPASHMGGIKKISHKVESISVCDIDKERRRHCREKWNIQNTYHRYTDLFKRENPDIAVIATWTETHKRIALHAAENGVKGIVLEKPVAPTLKQAREIIDACNANNVKLVINHERRWDPLYRNVKSIIDDQSLGRLKLIYGNVLSQSFPIGPWQDILPKVGGGPLLHDGTHLVDMIRYFAGEIVSLNGSVSREHPEAATETTATASMKAQNGVTVFLEAGGMRSHFNFELDLQFERGRIRVGNGIRDFFVVEKSTRYTGFHDLVRKEFPASGPGGDPFSGAILEVMNAIETGTVPKSSGRDGLKTMEVIFAIYYSALHNSKTVALPVKISQHPLARLFRHPRGDFLWGEALI